MGRGRGRKERQTPRATQGETEICGRGESRRWGGDILGLPIPRSGGSGEAYTYRAFTVHPFRFPGLGLEDRFVLPGERGGG